MAYKKKRGAGSTFRRRYKRRAIYRRRRLGPAKVAHLHRGPGSLHSIVTRKFRKYTHNNQDFNTPATPTALGGFVQRTWNTTDLIKFSDYSDIFRFYRIVGIKVTYLPLWKGGQPVSTQDLPVLYWTIDHGVGAAFPSIGSLPTVDTLEKYGTRFKVHRFTGDNPLVIKWKPNNIKTTPNNHAAYGHWHPVAATTQSYYGLTVYSTTVSASKVFYTNYTVEFTVQFKGQH